MLPTLQGILSSKLRPLLQFPSVPQITTIAKMQAWSCASGRIQERKLDSRCLGSPGDRAKDAASSDNASSDRLRSTAGRSGVVAERASA